MVDPSSAKGSQQDMRWKHTPGYTWGGIGLRAGGSIVRKNVGSIGEIHVAHVIVVVWTVPINGNEREVIAETDIHIQFVSHLPLIHGVESVHPAAMCGLNHIAA